MPANCIFCGGSPTTNEHIISEWITTVLKSDPRFPDVPNGMIPYEGARADDFGTVLKSYSWSASVVDLKVKAVCGPCNSGWMSRIEEAAQPYLTPMILGEIVHLDTNAQRAVATWIAMKGILTRYLGLDPVEQHWIDHMHTRRHAPDTWQIWLAGYNGKLILFDETHDLTNPLFMRASRTTHGVVWNAVIGYLTFKLLGVYKFPVQEPSQKALIRIWPRPRVSVEWPPDSVFGDGSIAAFFEMYRSIPSAVRNVL